MKLSIKAMAMASAVLWSLAILMVGIANLMFPDYGVNFLELIASIYPGYHAETGFTSTIIGSLYGFVDAGIAGTIFAWLYNCFSS